MTTDRFSQALREGPMALLKLRAEVLLEHEAEWTIPLTDGERARLRRIATEPAEEDREFLGTFDRFYEENWRWETH
jgi:hypothetical protein